MSINLSKSVAGAGENLVSNLQRRFAQVLERAETHPQPGALERVARAAETQGQEAVGLIARFQELIKPQAKEPLAKLPHSGYIKDILAGKSVLKPGDVFKELAAQTPAESGLHKLALSLEGLQERLPAQNIYSHALNQKVLTEEMNISSGEIANRLSKVVLSAHGHWGNLSTEEMKAAFDFIKELPGLSDTARMHIAGAERRTAELFAKRETVVTHWFSKDEKVVNRDVDQQIKAIYKSTFDNIVGSVAVPVRDVAAEKAALFQKLLDYKINKSGEWKVYSAESWQKIQESSKGTLSGSTSSSSSSLTERALLEKAVSTEVSGAFSGSTANNVNGQILKSVNLQIPNTHVNAPMVSVQHVMQTKGDYIVYGGGQLHVLNSEDLAGWFQLAKREVIHNAR